MAKDLIGERLRTGVNRQDTVDVLNRTVAESAARAETYFELYSGNNLGPSYANMKARGTAAVPANVIQDDSLGVYYFKAYSNSFQNTASIEALVDAAVVAGQRPASRLEFKTNANNTAPALAMHISREGYIGIGSAFNPAVAATRAAYDIHAAKLDSVGRLQVQFMSFGTATDGPYIAVSHARGTFAAPANNVDGDNLGDFEFYAYAGGWQQAAEIRSFVTGAVVNGTTPSTNMTFKVTTGGTMSTRGIFFSTGRFALGSASRASETDSTNNGAGALWVAENNNRPQICFHSSENNVNAAQILGRKNRGGSLSAPTNIANGDSICELRAGALSNTWFDDLGYLEFAVDAAVVAGQRPASRFGIWVNANNAAANETFRLRSDRTFVMGYSMAQFTDAKFNFSLPGGADTVAATFGMDGGSPNSMIIGFSTYSAGYTNGHPARMYIQDSNFSCSIRFDHKLQNASSNGLAPSLLLSPATNMPNAAFFSSAGSYGNGQGMIFIANRNTAPTANPSGGGVLYAEGGALRWRGSAGTTTTIANA